MIHDSVVHKITRRNPFLQDWPYYGIVDILKPVATAQYQHGVTIPTKPGMMHDFRDLRFFQADGTEIPFWNESKTDGSTSFNWIKPYSASQRKAYVFYGNREAVSQSNGDLVFEFFDDFLGSALDTTKWTLKSGSPTIASSIITLSGATVWINTGNRFGVGVSTISKASRTLRTDVADTTYILYDKADNSAYFGMQTTYSAPSSTRTWLSQTGLAAGTNFSTQPDNTMHRWEHIRDGTNQIMYVDGALQATRAYNGTEITGYSYISDNAAAIIAVDWIAVRKYTATEPVCQLNQSGLRNPTYR